MPDPDELRRSIEQITADAKTAGVGVALRDFENDFQFQLNADRVFHAASTMKVAVLLALFRAVDEGRIVLDDPLHVRNFFRSAIDRSPFHLDHNSDGYPDLYRRVGRTAKLRDLADVMITSSSNLATNLLLDFLGVDYTRGVLRQANVAGLEIRRGVDDEKAFAAGLNNETSAQALVELFSVLRGGEFLSKESREGAIAVLLRQRFDSMIPSQLPKHATVAHKTGEISTACHDAGIVYVPERQPYVIAILTEVNPDADVRRDTVARISKAIFDALIGEPKI